MGPVFGTNGRITDVLLIQSRRDPNAMDLYEEDGVESFFAALGREGARGQPRTFVRQERKPRVLRGDHIPLGHAALGR